VVEFRDTVDGVTAGALRGFFVGWPEPPTPERHLELLRESTHVVVALDGERVVGFVTAISDGVMSAYVPLLEVLPEYQGRGIGTELMRRLLARLEGLYMVDLACDDELVPFYERLGLRRTGVAMGIRRRSALRRIPPALAFDDVVIVDWSAASNPKRGADSIWIGHVGSPGTDPLNVATRGQALRVLADRLLALIRQGRRVLIGFDFPYGYPRGTAERIGPSGEWGDEPPWLRLWNELASLVADGPTNANNRFEVAAELNRRGACFWGRPATSHADVPTTRQPFTLPEFRATEELLRSQARHPKSVWQLSGAGSVGGQALLGIPIVRALRFDERLADVSRVWPFETGFELPHDVQIVHAEIWPGVVQPDATAHAVADARQVLTLARYLHEHRELERLFAAGAGDDDAAVEEGWILGAV
jgi:GNAT superfamily N-acetyltransferase